MNVMAVDLDGTLTHQDGSLNRTMRAKVNAAFEDKNNFIVIHTARSYEIFHETRKFLLDNGIKHHALVMEKMRADVYIDDKAGML